MNKRDGVARVSRRETGVTLIFVGPPGSGKTQIINTLYRWYETVGVSIKTRNVEPSFDAKRRHQLKSECERCVEKKTTSSSTIHAKRNDDVFEGMGGGGFGLDLPKKWFVSYVWATDEEKRKNMTDDFIDKNVRVRLCETSDASSSFIANIRVFVHVLSLDPLEIEESFRFFRSALNDLPNTARTKDDSTVTYRFVLYTKCDKYKPREDASSYQDCSGIIDYVLKDAESFGVSSVYLTILRTRYKLTTCTNDDDVKYDSELGVLPFLFDLVGTLLKSEAQRERRIVANRVGMGERDVLLLLSTKESEGEERITQKLVSAESIVDRIDEGCCYQ